MASESSSVSPARRNSNTQLLQELEALSQSLYLTHTTNTNPATTSNRRTASLVLPRTSVLAPIISSDEPVSAAKIDDKLLNPKPLSRRRSLSPWRSRPKIDGDHRGGDDDPPKQTTSKKLDVEASSASASEKKGGLWNWKPIRALSRIGMQKLSCLFSVEVVAAQGLPASMNGLRLSVSVRKKESKDGAVNTMPSRVSQGAADFEETLFIRCHVYCSPSSSLSAQQQQVKFEPRPFLINVFAVDAPELDLGRNYVDLSLLIQESINKSSQGTRVRQWDMTFDLSGKAKGGQLVLKLGFQLMEKDGGGGGGGVGILYSSPSKSNASNNNSRSFGRRQSKSSFSIPSPRLSGRSADAWTPSQSDGGTSDLHGIDDLNLDEEPQTSAEKSQGREPEAAEANNNKIEDVELPEFEIVDKGVEIQDKVASAGGEYSGQSDGENSDKRSVSSIHEIVKEIVHDQLHLNRLSELDSIARQIKALESMMITDDKPVKADEETESQRLDADEETVTREFLQMLEDEDRDAGDYLMMRIKPQQRQHQHVKQLEEGQGSESNSKVFLADLGKGLGCVVQTRDGEFGFELLQRMAGLGSEALGSEIGSLMPLDELMGKTAEQVAFEGVASAIIQGRNKEGASSSAARTVAAVKGMASAMSSVGADDILALSMQKIEAMAIEALRIQADVAEKLEAPFEVSPLPLNDTKRHPLAAALALEEWMKKEDDEDAGAAAISLILAVQLRDPLRRYEAVGGPVMVLINASRIDNQVGKFKVSSMHLGGLKLARRNNNKRNINVWDAEKQRLTAVQWLVAYGLGKQTTGKRSGLNLPSKHHDLLWSISSRVMADMWLKPTRNPDIKLSN
ncbi:hypothetical protein NMG60_11031035 [Bertholletia excelsa]